MRELTIEEDHLLSRMRYAHVTAQRWIEEFGLETAKGMVDRTWPADYPHRNDPINGAATQAFRTAFGE